MVIGTPVYFDTMASMVRPSSSGHFGKYRFPCGYSDRRLLFLPKTLFAFTDKPLLPVDGRCDDSRSPAVEQLYRLLCMFEEPSQCSSRCQIPESKVPPCSSGRHKAVSTIGLLGCS